MTKSDFIYAVAEKAGVSKKDAEAIVKASIDTIVAAVANGDSIQFTGFGTFEPKACKARIGINPATKEKIEIAAKTVPNFKAGKAFKDAVK